MECPSMPYLVRSLQREQMLPAIVFIFSRAGCDEAAEQATSSRQPLLSPHESEQVEELVAAFRHDHQDLSMDETRLSMLSSGVASHHAGMLPLELT